MKNQKGIISTIILIIVALIILGYFHISFKSILMSPLVKSNLDYAWNLFVTGFNSFVSWIKSFLNI